MSEVGHFSDSLSMVPRALSKHSSRGSVPFDTKKRNFIIPPLQSSTNPQTALRKKGKLSSLGFFAGMIAVGVVALALPIQSQSVFFLGQRDIFSLLGFGIEQVTLSGHRSTSDEDIFEVLKLHKTPTFFAFSTVDAQKGLKELPWIKDVSIKKVWPNQVALHFAEREPFAVWQHGQNTVLIDREGRILGPLKSDLDLPFPKFMGEGANTTASEFWSVLQSYPQLRNRVQSAEYVDRRRWSVMLKNGAQIDFPADFEVSALSLVTSNMYLKDLLEKPLCHLDLRIPHRVILRADPKSNVNMCNVAGLSESKR